MSYREDGDDGEGHEARRHHEAGHHHDSVSRSVSTLATPLAPVRSHLEGILNLGNISNLNILRRNLSAERPNLSHYFYPATTDASQIDL